MRQTEKAPDGVVAPRTGYVLAAGDVAAIRLVMGSGAPRMPRDGIAAALREFLDRSTVSYHGSLNDA
jgi:hypothetical protein